MAELNYEEELFNAPIPGEAMVVEPGRYPYDRPPQFTDGEEAMAKLMKSLSRPKTMNKLLDALSMGIPMDSIAAVVLQSMFGEGLIPAQLVPLMAPAVIALLDATAEKAGIQGKMSADFAPNEGQQISEEDISASLGEVEEVIEESPVEPTAGLMTRPEAI